MRIYVASSWRNKRQPEVVERLRAEGHEVYDFRNPAKGDHGFAWSEIDPEWQKWSPFGFLAGLRHPLAERGFGLDFDAMKWADACVYVQPCGVSASLEAGWFAGTGKPCVVLLEDGCEPELMLKLCTDVVATLDEAVAAISRHARTENETQSPEPPKTRKVKIRISLSGTLRNLVDAVLEPEEAHPPSLWGLEAIRKHLAIVKQRHEAGDSKAVLDEFFDLYTDVDGCIFCGGTGRMWTRRELPEDAEKAATWRGAPLNLHGYQYLRPCVEGCAPKADGS